MRNITKFNLVIFAVALLSGCAQTTPVGNIVSKDLIKNSNEANSFFNLKLNYNSIDNNARIIHAVHYPEPDFCGGKPIPLSNFGNYEKISFSSKFPIFIIFESKKLNPGNLFVTGKLCSVTVQWNPVQDKYYSINTMLNEDVSPYSCAVSITESNDKNDAGKDINYTQREFVRPWGVNGPWCK